MLLVVGPNPEASCMHAYGRRKDGQTRHASRQHHGSCWLAACLPAWHHPSAEAPGRQQLGIVKRRRRRVGMLGQTPKVTCAPRLRVHEISARLIFLQGK
jgi:hypothetical protein